MKVQIVGLAAAGLLLALVSVGPARAQDNTGGGAGGGTAATSDGQGREDRGFNPGWLGLIGLAGLAGLRRPQQTVVPRDTTSRL